jgi:hypothetical protein
MEQNVATLFFIFYEKIVKKQQKPKNNMFLTSLHHLQCLFSVHLVVNTLFFKEIKIQKKSKFTKRPNRWL